MPYSDYVVYVDESGDHSLQSIDPNFPVFSLAFCIFKKSDFVETVVPSVQRLKFEFWGHDAAVLHGHGISLVGWAKALFAPCLPPQSS